MMSKNISWLVFGLLLILIVQCSAQRKEALEIGDECRLINGAKGVCKIDNDCPYAIDLFKQGKRSKIVPCGSFVGRFSVVCCGPTGPSNIDVNRCLGNEQQRPKEIKKKPSLDFHILNGERADIGEFPFMATLGFRKDIGSEEFDFNKCGGTLIHKDFVLTAAHCVNQRPVPEVVMLGKTSLDDEDEKIPQQIKIREIIRHEDYKVMIRLNDIALVRLDKSASIAFEVFPACLSGGDKKNLNNLNVIGFGRNSPDNHSVSNWLLKANTTEVAIPKCTSQLKGNNNKFPIEATQVCAFDAIRRSDSCQGDSGGPLFYIDKGRAYIYGIVSYGQACGSSLPSIYTRVDRYLEWISSKINS